MPRRETKILTLRLMNDTDEQYFAAERFRCKEFHHFYSICPIDFWAGWRLICKTPSFSSSGPVNIQLDYGWLPEWLGAVLQTFDQMGWELDGAVYIAGVPSHECEDCFVVAVKQGNNGTVFIASPYRLPWLTEQLDYRTK